MQKQLFSTYKTRIYFVRIRRSNTGIVPGVPTHENKYIFMFSNKNTPKIYSFYVEILKNKIDLFPSFFSILFCKSSTHVCYLQYLCLCYVCYIIV